MITGPDKTADIGETTGGEKMAKIDHAAIRTTAYEEAQKFFEDVFEMHIWRETWTQVLV